MHSNLTERVSMLSKNILIVDCSAVCHYVRHAFDTLSYGDERTGIIYGFFNTLKAAASKLRADTFVFAWDSKHSLRKKIYPEYKKSRNVDNLPIEDVEALQLLWSQIDELRNDLIPFIGFSNSFMISGLEADDIIAYVASNTPGTKYIMSRDNDLFQLLSDDIHVYDFKTRTVFDKDDFYGTYGIPSDMWAEVKAIAGCNTDMVSGIPGVGVKTAIKYLNRTLPSSYKAYKAIESGGDIIERNKKLVTLPFEYDYTNIDVIDDFVSKDRLQEVFERYGFTSMISKMEDFCYTFGAYRND